MCYSSSQENSTCRAVPMKKLGLWKQGIWMPTWKAAGSCSLAWHFEMYTCHQLLSCDFCPSKRKAANCHARKFLLMALSQHSLTFIGLRLSHSCVLLQNRTIGAFQAQSHSLLLLLLQHKAPEALLRAELEVRMSHTPNLKSLSRLGMLNLVPNLNVYWIFCSFHPRFTRSSSITLSSLIAFRTWKALCCCFFCTGTQGPFLHQFWAQSKLKPKPLRFPWPALKPEIGLCLCTDVYSRLEATFSQNQMNLCKMTAQLSIASSGGWLQEVCIAPILQWW